MPAAHAHAERPEDTVWRLTPDLRLHMRRVGAMVAVFNEESGDTHLVAPWAAQILERLRAGPARAEDLDARKTGGGEDPVQAVARSLSEFRYLGLIEPVDP